MLDEPPDLDEKPLWLIREGRLRSPRIPQGSRGAQGASSGPQNAKPRLWLWLQPGSSSDGGAAVLRRLCRFEDEALAPSASRMRRSIVLASSCNRMTVREGDGWQPTRCMGDMQP